MHLGVSCRFTCEWQQFVASADIHGAQPVQFRKVDSICMVRSINSVANDVTDEIVHPCSSQILVLVIGSRSL